MQNFKDDYGILALAGAQKIAAIQNKEIVDMDEFFGELEEVLQRINSRLVTQEQYSEHKKTCQQN